MLLGLQGLTFFLSYAILAAVLGMLQFGYNTGVINAPQIVSSQLLLFHLQSDISLVRHTTSRYMEFFRVMTCRCVRQREDDAQSTKSSGSPPFSIYAPLSLPFSISISLDILRIIETENKSLDPLT